MSSLRVLTHLKAAVGAPDIVLTAQAGGLEMARVALVTGGTRGIGAAVSQALQAAGYRVAATYAGNAEAAKAFMSRTGISSYQWDIGDFDACAIGAKSVEASLGPIDVLVNNAGIVRDATLHMSRTQWEAVIRTNLDGAFNMCRQVIDGMRTRRYGRIINIPSINGQKGQFGQTNYSAAKAGELGFAKALALETAVSESPSTPSARAISIPRCWMPCREMFWRRAFCRKFRSAVLVAPKRLRAPWCFWRQKRRTSSLDRHFRSMAAST
ncbi:NADP-dependent 3-hydroxy acid dehydrogenase YdfG [Bradyrhizobium sp. LA6.1]